MDLVAIVTASTEGIGLAIARKLASDGAKVMISSRKVSNKFTFWAIRTRFYSHGSGYLILQSIGAGPVPTCKNFNKFLFWWICTVSTVTTKQKI